MRRQPVLAHAAAALVFVAVTACFARPQAPPVALTTGPAAVVSVTGGTVAGKIRWKVSPAAISAGSGQSLAVWGPAGDYTVTAVLPGDDGAICQTVVAIGQGVGPGPAPVPSPGPAPGPVVVTPTAPKTWAIAVFDTSQKIALPPGQLALWTSQTVAPALGAQGVTYRHYDVADPAVVGSDWGKAALRLQKPALVLWRDGAIVAGYPKNLPATEADLIGLATR